MIWEQLSSCSTVFQSGSTDNGFLSEIWSVKEDSSPDSLVFSLFDSSTLNNTSSDKLDNDPRDESSSCLGSSVLTQSSFFQSDEQSDGGL